MFEVLLHVRSRGRAEGTRSRKKKKKIRIRRYCGTAEYTYRRSGQTSRVGLGACHPLCDSCTWVPRGRLYSGATPGWMSNRRSRGPALHVLRMMHIGTCSRGAWASLEGDLMRQTGVYHRTQKKRVQLLILGGASGGCTRLPYYANLCHTPCCLL